MSLKVGDEVYFREHISKGKGAIKLDDESDFLPFLVEIDNLSLSCNESALIKVTQEKPVVIGFTFVYATPGKVNLVNSMKRLNDAIATAHVNWPSHIHKNGKPKFRLVYAKRG